MKYKITFLLDETNLWFEKYLKKCDFRLNKKYSFKIRKNPNNVSKQDIVFPLCYTKILSDKFINKNKLVLIVHCSKLPKDKGFAPIAYQVLKNKKIIYVSLIKAVKEVDAGPIFLRQKFKLDGTELCDELRSIQAKAVLNIIKNFLIIFPKVKSTNQKGKSSFNKRRKLHDSELNINKTIKSQFNLLRTADNLLYPSYFKFKKQKYILKIFKAKE